MPLLDTCKFEEVVIKVKALFPGQCQIRFFFYIFYLFYLFIFITQWQVTLRRVVQHG